MLVTFPNDILHQKTSPVTDFSTDIGDLANQLMIYCLEEGGYGMAAPQLGESISLFVINPRAFPFIGPVFVNPLLVWSKGRQVGIEGCFSFPEILCEVQRAKQAHILAWDVRGKRFSVTCKGQLARVVLHELDHLRGKTMVDRAKRVIVKENYLNKQEVTEAT